MQQNADQPLQPHLHPPNREYRFFLRQMWDRVHSMTVLDSEGIPHRPLARIDTRVGRHGRPAEMDFSKALLDAWAMVCDVLSFYTQNIGDEAYLPTALEERSVRELAHMIGYRPDPGLSASVLAAFMLGESKKSLQTATVPEGTLLQNTAPTPETSDQHFETIESLEARVQWNHLQPYRPPQPQKQIITTGVSRLRLAHYGPLPRSGDLLLIEGKIQKGDLTQAISLVRTIEDVSKETDLVLISWKNPQDGEEAKRIAADHVLQDTSLRFFSKQTALFGATAVLWDTVPDQLKTHLVPPDGGLYLGGVGKDSWLKVGLGLPEGTPSCLTLHPSGTIFVCLNGQGLFRSVDQGRTWQLSVAGLSTLNILSLTVDSSGDLYAGSANGKVFRSVYLGESWTPVQKSVVENILPETAVRSVLPLRGRPHRPFFDLLRAKLEAFEILKLLNPKTYVIWFIALIKAFLDYLGGFAKKSVGFFRTIGKRLSRNSKTVQATAQDPNLFLLVGTEHGVFRYLEDGWSPVNKGLPFRDPKTGEANLTVYQLIRQDSRILAATDQGIYVSKNMGYSWQAQHHGLPIGQNRLGPKTTCLTQLPLEHSKSLLLAGTEHGIFVSEDGGLSWTSNQEGLPTNTQVSRFALHQSPEKTVLFIATNQGIFSRTPSNPNWLAENENLFVRLFDVEKASLDPLKAGLVSKQWRATFHDHQITLSPHAIVKEREPGRAWSIGDAPQNAAYRITTNGRYFLVQRRITGIMDIAVSQDGCLLINTPPGRYNALEWPEFRIQSNYIDLEEKLDGLMAQDALLLRQGERHVLLKIQAVTTHTRTDYGETRTITRLHIHDRDDLDIFDLRHTQVHLFSQKPALHWSIKTGSDPLYGEHLDVAPSVPELPTGRKLILSGQRARVRFGVVGGVFNLSGPTRSRDGLPHHHVYALLFDGYGRLHAATERGIHIRRPSGWASLGLNQYAVIDLAMDHSINEIYAIVVFEKTHNLMRYRQGRWLKLDIPFQPNKILMSHEDHKLYAIADHACWFSEDHGESWRARNAGLNKARLTCIAQTPDQGLVMGTYKHGIYVLPPQKNTWMAINMGLRIKDPFIRQVNCIAVNPISGKIFAGVGNRVYSCDNPQSPWENGSHGLPDSPITSLLYTSQGIYAGTNGDGIFHDENHCGSWLSMPLGISNHVTALASADQGIWAGTSADTVLSNSFGVRSRLSTKRLFSLPFKHRPDPDTFLENFSEAFLLEDIVLDETDQLETIANKGWMLRQEKRCYTIYQDNDQLRVYRPMDSLIVAAPPQPHEDGLYAWTLENHKGTQLNLIAAQDDLLWEHALPTDATVGEPKTLMGSHNQNPGFSRLILNEACRHCYDPASLQIFANVAMARHGKKVDEILGNGNSETAFQRFSLKHGPLTYSVESQKSQPQLEVFINPGDEVQGIPWTMTTSLFENSPRDRVFMMFQSGDGQQSLIFGDGFNGARLPSGRANVHATYRIGLGHAGNIAAETMTTMLNRPAGIRTVLNPLPGEGGVDPENEGSIRLKAPISTRPLNRIVSLQDAQDLASLYPGIDQVSATLLKHGPTTIAHLTICRLNGQALYKHSTFYTQLLGRLQSQMAMTHISLVLDSYQEMEICLSATIRIQPSAHWDHVYNQVLQTLWDHYGTGRCRFGSDLVAAQVVKTINDVPSVLSAELTAFFPRAGEPELRERIPTRKAFWDRNTARIRPATILVINKRDIQLQWSK